MDESMPDADVVQFMLSSLVLNNISTHSDDCLVCILQDK